MSQQNNWVTIGQFGRVHGVKGLIKVHAFTETPQDIFNYPDWYVYEKNTWRPIKRLSNESAYQRLLVKIQGYETREKAALLTQYQIGVKRELLPQLDNNDFYYFELIGMSVVTLHQERLGEVVQVLETGANDVLVIEGEKRHLIPYLLERVVKSVSREKRQIVVDWDDDFL